jgi:hypothetical protein
MTLKGGGFGLTTIQDWKKLPMLLCLQRVIEGGGADNKTKMILGALTNEGGLIPHHITDRFMAFNANGASILLRVKNDVTNKL